MSFAREAAVEAAERTDKLHRRSAYRHWQSDAAGRCGVRGRVSEGVRSAAVVRAGQARCGRRMDSTRQPALHAATRPRRCDRRVAAEDCSAADRDYPARRCPGFPAGMRWPTTRPSLSRRYRSRPRLCPRIRKMARCDGRSRFHTLRTPRMTTLPPAASGEKLTGSASQMPPMSCGGDLLSRFSSGSAAAERNPAASTRPPCASTRWTAAASCRLGARDGSARMRTVCGFAVSATESREPSERSTR